MWLINDRLILKCPFECFIVSIVTTLTQGLNKTIHIRENVDQTDVKAYA